MSRAVTLEVDVPFAWYPDRPAGKRKLHAAPALEVTDMRDLHAGRARRGTQRVPLARWHSDHEFVVVTAAQHLGPQLWVHGEHAPRIGRQRHAFALDYNAKP